MSERLAESRLLIGSTVLSNDSISHRQFASIAPAPLDFVGSVVGTPALARMVFYMSIRLAESASFIGSTVLSIASHSHRHRSANPHLQPLHPPILKKGSSILRGFIEWCFIWLKDSLKVPYRLFNGAFKRFKFGSPIRIYSPLALRFSWKEGYRKVQRTSIFRRALKLQKRAAARAYVGI
jgi:hypothetical protein